MRGVSIGNSAHSRHFPLFGENWDERKKGKELAQFSRGQTARNSSNLRNNLRKRVLRRLAKALVVVLTL